ncbi:rhomboid family intramembrane serine protease [Chitinivorax sp. B]|uniref:rhomboid family intramembrane serine protease n=1 Tax=Chitinivorax sp. B TaxID=2502235 RepID=UPI0010F7AE8C|nr:rhomboid family intramembrane serine protease [Chitinivorax sp. B]
MLIDYLKRTRSALITWLILILNVLGMLVPLLHGGESHSFTMIESGANYAPLTLTGDNWRLLSSMFLHGGVIHLALNMLMLLIVGPMYEAHWGRVRFLLLYLAAGMAASLASALWYGNHQITQVEWVFLMPIEVSGIQPVVSMGASGALMGLIGSHLGAVLANLFSWKACEVEGASLREDAYVVGSTLVLGLLLPAMDNAAHLVGWLSGVLIGLGWATTERLSRIGMRRCECALLAALIGLLLAPLPESWASAELRSYREAYWPTVTPQTEQYDPGLDNITDK